MWPKARLAITAVLMSVVSAMAADQRVRMRANGGLEVDGKPFVPIILWAQPSSNIARIRAMGVNTVHVGEQEAKDPLKAYLSKAQENGILVLIDEGRLAADIKDHPAILAWTVEHEPDMVRGGKQTADRLPEVQKAKYQRIRTEAPGSLTWAIYTGWFYDHYRKIPIEQYHEYFRYADVLAFDHYPVTGWNRPDRLPEVGLATREMVRMARPGKPVWTFVEASDQELTWTAKETRGPSPEEMRAEVWSSIANGAKGIGYFTISFGRGKKFQWTNLTAEMETMMQQLNGQLQELAGPIAAGTAGELAVSGDETGDVAAKGHAIHAMRREYAGKTWIVAVNVTREKVRPTFTAQGLGAQQLTIWKEGRNVSLQNGRFSDDFAPLALHIYTDAE